MAHAGHAMLDAMKAAGSRLQGKRHSATPRDAQPVHIAEDTMEKLFGASEESLQRKVETAEHGRLVIHPHSRFRAAWEAVGAALVLTICVMLPVEVAFWDVCTSAESGYAAPPAWRAFTTFVDFFFLTDVVLTFATGYYHEDVLVMAHRRIARRYASRAIRVAIRAAIRRDSPTPPFHTHPSQVPRHLVHDRPALILPIRPGDVWLVGVRRGRAADPVGSTFSGKL